MKPNPFDELAKSMAQSVTRRQTMKQFGFGLTTLALATLGLATKAEAAKGGGGPLPGDGHPCTKDGLCQPGLWCYKGPTPYQVLSRKYYGTCRPPSGPGGPCYTTANCLPGLVCIYWGGKPGAYCGHG